MVPKANSIRKIANGVEYPVVGGLITLLTAVFILESAASKDIPPPK